MVEKDRTCHFVSGRYIHMGAILFLTENKLLRFFFTGPLSPASRAMGFEAAGGFIHQGSRCGRRRRFAHVRSVWLRLEERTA